MGKIIPRIEVVFNKSSYVDPNARVFEWQGEIYRGIVREKEEFFSSLVKSETFNSLQRKGWLINTAISGHSLAGYAFVLKHERVPFLSYCVEWPAVMLRDAALLTLNICYELAASALSLQDAYPWNVYFKFTRPVFIDIGSIVEAPADLLWTSYQQFCQFFLYALYLSSAGNALVARKLLSDYLQGIEEGTIVKMLPLLYKLRNPKICQRVVFPYWLEKVFPNNNLQSRLAPLIQATLKKIDLTKLRLKFLDQLIKEVAAISLPRQKTPWSDYYGADFAYGLENSAGWNQKQKAVAQILEQLRPKSVLDVACNRGWFSLLAASKGCQVVAFDRDENCIAQLYYDAKENNARVLPLIMDLLNPTPAFGWNAAQFPSAIDRFRCELVFAFAIVHHLVFKQLQNFDRVVETLNSFTGKWLLLEFPSPEDEKVKGMWQERCSWYNLDNLNLALAKHFKIIKVVDSYPATRKLILCEKNEGD